MFTDFPCAKINLGLNIVNRRADGYHDLETVFYPVGICDEIRMEACSEAETNGEACRFVVEGLDIEGDINDNLVVKACRMVKEKHKEMPAVKIVLKKQIPMQAGMGGGSADCAYTITMLNRLFSLGMSKDEMKQMAATLGADCAFFIDPVPAFATGIGEKLEPIDVDLSGYCIAIVKPALKISTREAFAHVTPCRPEKCCKDIVMSPIATWKEELVNDFEKSIISTHPEIADIKQRLYDMGAVYAAMTGSGSALFAFFSIDKTAPDAELKNNIHALENALATTFANCFTFVSM